MPKKKVKSKAVDLKAKPKYKTMRIMPEETACKFKTVNDDFQVEYLLGNKAERLPVIMVNAVKVICEDMEKFKKFCDFVTTLATPEEKLESTKPEEEIH